MTDQKIWNEEALTFGISRDGFMYKIPKGDVTKAVSHPDLKDLEQILQAVKQAQTKLINKQIQDIQDSKNLLLKVDENNGDSWTNIERIIDYPKGKSASDPSFILDDDTGVIFLFYNYMDLVNEKDVYYLHVIKSKDNGRTWSKPQDITSQISKPE